MKRHRAWWEAFTGVISDTEIKQVRALHPRAHCSSAGPGEPFIVYAGGGLRSHDRHIGELGRGSTPSKAWGQALKNIRQHARRK